MPTMPRITGYSFVFNHLFYLHFHFRFIFNTSNFDTTVFKNREIDTKTLKYYSMYCSGETRPHTEILKYCICTIQ